MDMEADMTSDLYLGELNDTPVGDLRLVISDLGLVAVEWAESLPDLDRFLRRLARPVKADAARVSPFAKQVFQYLSAQRRDFTFAVDWSILRPFQRTVLEAVFAIPYGETCTYAEIAVRIGRPNAYRAVGRANATNPMPLVIPCHRVIGMDGKLHGYGGGDGLPTKEWLLQLEGAVLA
jgi:methylated-DNA-[protein]-cysteine S-methyltransferase